MVTYHGVQEPVTAAVWYALNNYCYKDATFIAERLHAEVHSLDTILILATCYYRSGKLQQAKDLLSTEMSSVYHHRQCTLLYAQCCLDLKEYGHGVMALNNILGLQEISESDLCSFFQEDVGVAFLLLGKLKLHLQHKTEAASCFHAALKHNPLLWSAFEALCEMGKEVNPEECFKVSEYPAFLKSHPSTTPTTTFENQAKTIPVKSQTLNAAPSSTQVTQDGVNLMCSEVSVPHICPDEERTVSAFQPVKKGKQVFMTPDIFHHESSVGDAIASSTPAGHRTFAVREKLSLTLGLSGEGEGKKGGGGGGRRQQDSDFAGVRIGSGLNRVKGILDFGSTGGRKSGIFGSVKTQKNTTPLNPSFGVLSLTTPLEGGVQILSMSPQQALNFSSLVMPSPQSIPPDPSLITPSPQPLPPDYLKLIQSAPKSAKKVHEYSFATPPVMAMTDSRTGMEQLRTGPHSPMAARQSNTPYPLFRSTSDTPHPLARKTSAYEPPEHSTREVTPNSSHQVKEHTSKNAAPLRLRRSERLIGSTNKRLSEHAIHSTRNKSRLKSPTSVRRGIDTATKKGPKGVTFGASVKTRGGSSSSSSSSPATHSKRSTKSSNTSSVGVASPGNTPLPPSSVVASNVLASKQNMENVQRSVGGEGEGKEMEVDKKENWTGGEGEDLVRGLSEAVLAQQVLEQAAMVGLTSLMKLVSHLGQAYQLLMNFDLGKAVDLFQSLPMHQWNTPWVLVQMGHVYFAAERFKKAAELFKQAHKLDPHRQEGMDLYSSSLWHLQQTMELSMLAQYLYTSNKQSPQALCAMASLKNLYKEHSAAINFLTNAIQVAPEFAYAHTLLGHEYWLAKDYDKAISSFQNATTIQPRHYNAWYGMAHVSFAQEKYQAAELYAGRALSINGCSSIACTQMGLAQLRQGKHEEALTSFDRALKINPFNPIPRFHRAKTLESQGLLEESLKQLDILAKSWPKEPNIYISKGKILKRLNRTHEAALQFSWALDYSRSGGSNSQIREEIDQAYHNQNSCDLGDDSDADFAPLDDQPLNDEEDESFDVVGESDRSMLSD